MSGDRLYRNSPEVKTQGSGSAFGRFESLGGNMKSFSRPARLSAAFALVLGGVGTATLASAGAANADPPCIYHYNYGATPGQSVWGSGSVSCLGYQIAVPVWVYQDGTQVATGRGLATYTCQGTAVRHYGISYNQGATMTYSFDAACG